MEGCLSNLIEIKYLSRRDRVLGKTNYRCSICGNYDSLIVCEFIPTWTKVPMRVYENQTPLCKVCSIKRNSSFIELGMLQYLPIYYRNGAILFYKKYRNYLRKMIFSKCNPKTNIDIDYTLLVMKSYDVYIQENKL